MEMCRKHGNASLVWDDCGKTGWTSCPLCTALCELEQARARITVLEKAVTTPKHRKINMAKVLIEHMNESYNEKATVNENGDIIFDDHTSRLTLEESDTSFKFSLYFDFVRGGNTDSKLDTVVSVPNDWSACQICFELKARKIIGMQMK